MKKIGTFLAVLVIVAATIVVFKKRIETAAGSRAAAEWQIVKTDTSIAELQSFIAKYPRGAFSARARARLDSLEMERDWRRALAADTPDALLQFTAKFPTNPYLLKADSLLARFQAQKDWREARSLNAPQAFQNILTKYPNTVFAAKAESSLIALEVAGIFKREYSALPSPQRLTAVDSPTALVEIENQTRYTLTVRYSGKDSKRLTLRPREKTTTALAVGRYRVTASADKPEVIPFAGDQLLEGGEYVSRYFIRGQ